MEIYLILTIIGVILVGWICSFMYIRQQAKANGTTYDEELSNFYYRCHPYEARQKAIDEYMRSMIPKRDEE